MHMLVTIQCACISYLGCVVHVAGVEAVFLGEELLLGKEIGLTATISKWRQ